MFPQRFQCIFFCKWKAKASRSLLMVWRPNTLKASNWLLCVWVWKIVGLKNSGFEKKRHLSSCGLHKDSRISFSFNEARVNQETAGVLGSVRPTEPHPRTLHWFLSDGNKVC